MNCEILGAEPHKYKLRVLYIVINWSNWRFSQTQDASQYRTWNSNMEINLRHFSPAVRVPIWLRCISLHNKQPINYENPGQNKLPAFRTFHQFPARSFPGIGWCHIQRALWANCIREDSGECGNLKITPNFHRSKINIFPRRRNCRRLGNLEEQRRTDGPSHAHNLEFIGRACDVRSGTQRYAGFPPSPPSRNIPTADWLGWESN